MSDTATLVRALRILARDIHCEDGIATQCIAEAADAIERLRLTDEEREAVAIMERVANRTETLVVGIGPRHAKRFDGPTIAATLRGLLERTQ